MKLSIEHETIYRYDAPVRSSTQYIRLSPRETPRQKVLQWQIDTPRAATQTHDGYGNVLHVLTLDKPVREIRIRAHGVVEVTTTDEESGEPVASKLSPLVFLRSTPVTRADEAIAKFTEPYRRRGTVLAGLRDLGAAILKKLPPAAQGVEPATAALAFGEGLGSVRDHAHVFIACCVHLEVPARYVSGYLLSHSKDGTAIAGHAWAEARIADRWRSFDLANSRATGGDHVKIAVGADYLDACPIRGIRTGGGLETMEAHAKVSITQ